MGKRSIGAISRDALRNVVARYNAREVETFGGNIVTLAEIKAGAARYVTTKDGRVELREWQPARPTKESRPRCGAKCRSGQPCKARVVVRADLSFAKRCRLHGGLSTGPKSSPVRSSYTPERGAVIVRAIMRPGRHTIKQICAAGGIAPATFYQWRRQFPEFNHVVGLAYRAKLGRR